jgi:glycosyltransferase involved in cell wall biosynthesis
MSVAAEAHPRSVGVDVGPARPEPTGVGIYVRELIRSLASLAPSDVTPVGMRTSTAVTGGEPLGVTGFRGGHYLDWIIRQADGEARVAGCRLMHYTNAIAPPRARVPFVLSIHDLSVLRLPGSHPLSRLAIVPFMLAAAHRARIVIVPSFATANEVRRLLHVPPDRVAVVPLAARPAAPVGAERVLADLGLKPHRFVLALGTIEPRKNHVRLLAAFERMAHVEADLRLVIVGASGWRGRPFRRALARCPVRDRVVVAGWRSDHDLAALLASCAVMAYPSVYEGFGLPILEAMAAGAPVVTSRISAMAEVAGGAAVLVDPFDVGSIADGMLAAMRRRDELVAAGHARAAARSWLDVGRETLAVYDRAIAAR